MLLASAMPLHMCEAYKNFSEGDGQMSEARARIFNSLTIWKTLIRHLTRVPV